MKKHVNKSPSISPENRGSLTGLKLESSEHIVRPIIRRRCSSALPRTGSTILKPTPTLISDDLLKHRHQIDHQDQHKGYSLRRIRRTFSIPKLISTFHSIRHSRKQSAIDLKSLLKPTPEINSLNILGTVKKLVEPLSLSKRESSTGSFKKKPELCINLQSKSKTSKLLKTKRIKPNDSERMSSDKCIKMRHVFKKPGCIRGTERDSWSHTVKSILAGNIKTDEMLEPSSDEMTAIVNQPNAKSRSEERSYSYIKKYNTCRLLTVRSIVKNTDSKPKLHENNEAGKTQPVKEAPEAKETTQFNQPSGTKAVETNEESQTCNTILRPYIYAKVTRRSLYNKLKL